MSKLSKQWASLATGRAVASKHSVAIAPIATRLGITALGSSANREAHEPKPNKRRG